MNISELRAADVLAQRLFAAGCRYAFGMPGGEVLTIIDALEKAGIKFILVKHENAGGFIAEGVHHRDGAPAILVATVGPGAMNGINVVANAEQDRVPMIVLTGCVDADEALTYTHQILDHQQVMRPITKASYRLTSNSAGIIADKAVAVATEARCGPVHIDVPISVADTKVPIDTPKPRRASTSPAAPSGADAARAREAMAKAQRPIAIVGLDVLRDRSETVLRAFLEQFSIPFITTYKAKGVLPENHPLCLGAAGLSPLADKHLLPLVKQADLVLCIGYDPIEMRQGWRNAFDPNSQTIIDIAAVPNTHYMHQANLNLVAHSGETMEMLAELTPTREVWTGAEPKAVQTALSEAFPKDDEWGPAGAIDEARKVLPDNTLATADSGAHRILLSQMWACSEPRGLIQSSALCTMGCAVPMAIGLKIAEPKRPVISFSGDAGFLMVAGELATAVELNVAPIFLVFVDSSLALIELKQRQRQLPNKGVDFQHHDYAEIGLAFGGEGHTVSNREQLRLALNAALKCKTFSVIAAKIEPGGYDGRI